LSWACFISSIEQGMTNFIPHPVNQDGLTKLSGTIRNLKVTRAEGSFVLSKSDQTQMGWVAVAAATMGLSGQAASTISSDIEEAADFVEFELNGQPIQGWMWRNPFKEGDEVEVAAEPQGDHWEAYGIARPADQTIALYPHCSRGSKAHAQNAFKWWLLGGGIITFFYIPFLYLGAGIKGFYMLDSIWWALGLMAFFGLIAVTTAFQLRSFVKVTQKVLSTLGMPNPEQVDLRKLTKLKKTKQDPVDLGIFYFKY
jgi:hypothetical protein